MATFKDPRYFGAHYDSMKQRQIFMNIDEYGQKHPYAKAILHDPEKRILQLYKARMMIDILLTGKIVMTDSQYLDGIYWYSLASNDYESSEFFKFINLFPKDRIPIEIKLRKPSIEESYKAFLARGGVCCSYLSEPMMHRIEASYLAEQHGFQKEGGDLPLSEWFNRMRSNLDRDTQERFNLQQNFIELLSANTPKEMLTSYDPATYPAILQEVKRDVDFKWWLRKQQIQQGTSELLDLIERQLDPNDPTLPDRKVTLNKIIELKNSDPENVRMIQQCDIMWDAISYIYNHTIARQYACDAVDEGVMHIKRDPKQPNKVIDLDVGLTQGNIGYFANMPWHDFYDFLHASDLSAAREAWLKDFMCTEPNKRINYRLLDDYAKMITSHEDNTQIKKAKKASEVLKATLTVIPWLDKLVGGGSSLTTAFASSVGIYSASSIVILAIEQFDKIRNEVNVINVGLGNIANIRE